MTTCLLCESSGDSLLSWDQTDAKSGAPLPVSICKRCSLVAQTQLPTDDELQIYYSHNYRVDYKQTYRPKLKHVYRAGKAAINRIEFLYSKVNLAPKAEIIDIGAGGGEFLYMAKLANLNPLGIEPNAGYSSFAREQYGVDVVTSMLNDVGTYSADVITMFHVFEHLAHPKAISAQLWSALKADGHLFIEVPNILQADASPHNIFFKAHLVYYSRYTLEAMLSPRFELIEVASDGNLKMIFRKKPVIETMRLPSDSDLELTANRLAAKGWWEYLTKGKGILKPFRRCGQYLEELKIKGDPKTVLDNLFRATI